ncbi:MAG: fatty acid desaturase [Akkermansiaceae bacterium]|nr:fatty acid desaturase [Akkermansiaceae bacterium]MCP5550078.1 fatty acid desaturase [Akkermansiaceae bacterium]
MQEEDKTLTAQEKRRAEIAAWKQIVSEFEQPHAGRAAWQVINSVGGYALLWVAIYFAMRHAWWMTIPFIVLAAGMLIRIFIIFHDCGHGSFLKSRRANEIIGFICGVLTFTAFRHWRWEHSVHHASSGDLDRRGVGDIWTLTVQEYLEASRWKRFAYRMARNPLILFGVAPLVLFLIRERFPSAGAKPRDRRSILWTNLALLGMVATMSWIFGLVPYLLIQISMTGLSGAAGIWLFYVQHQFEDTYWERGDEWDYTRAALQGSSFYKLPRVLQWFSGNIGFHHIHHLSPKIPNYNLERCHDSHPIFRDVKPLTLLSSLKSVNFRLWDESNRRLVGYSHLNRVRREGREAA